MDKMQADCKKTKTQFKRFGVVGVLKCSALDVDAAIMQN